MSSAFQAVAMGVCDYNRRSLTYGYGNQALRAIAKTRQTTDLKGYIFITAGERSVTCGNKKSVTYGIIRIEK
ncbi:MAG: hypothetical protein LBM67_04685 [Lentimicrobiaceae bacterium]|jgi:hypothetical protein|nr:hypothetical protein [Lentimicrobiaceae bacterium]